MCGHDSLLINDTIYGQNNLLLVYRISRNFGIQRGVYVCTIVQAISPAENRILTSLNVRGTSFDVHDSQTTTTRKDCRLE